MKRKTLLLVALLLGAIVLASAWWYFSPREFRGRLVYTAGLVHIPEDPPSPTCLMTANGSYELDMPSWVALPVSLRDLDGKQVIVIGTLGTRRTMMRKHDRVIHVRNLRLN